jgi:CheY-like chemotaxis protein
LGKRTILIADDARVMRMLLRTWLERLGFAVVEAADAAQALAALERQPVDALITDVHMPGMTGLQLLEYVRAHHLLQALPVIVCSTLGSDSDHQRANTLGATASLSKPVGYPQLLAVLIHCGLMEDIKK